MVLLTVAHNSRRSVATVFIAALAVTDLFNCAVTIPATIAMEFSKRTLFTDLVCKGKHYYYAENRVLDQGCGF